ncbi:MAG: substrate-binding domain-containing protein, partial [Sphingobacterium sp.]
KIDLVGTDEESKAQILEFVVDNNLDAVLFATNYLAVDGLKALKEAKVPLPKMVAFDEHTLFKLHDPSISVISQDIEALTKELIATLIAEIEGKLKEVRQLTIPCSLIIRESSI